MVAIKTDVTERPHGAAALAAAEKAKGNSSMGNYHIPALYYGNETGPKHLEMSFPPNEELTQDLMARVEGPVNRVLSVQASAKDLDRFARWRFHPNAHGAEEN